MAWEWSHAPEAYHNVRSNIAAKPREWKEVVYAEWHGAYDSKGNLTGRLNQKRYEKALAWVKKPDSMTDDQLSEFIFDKSSEQRTCTEGGFDSHCCPFRCTYHLASFSSKEELEKAEYGFEPI